MKKKFQVFQVAYEPKVVDALYKYLQHNSSFRICFDTVPSFSIGNLFPSTPTLSRSCTPVCEMETDAY